jgi:uncharacterized protein YhbP (UPF0306 family)
MSSLPDHHFTDFIREHHILTLAVSHEGKPWCATCYYAYDLEKNIFIFTSDPETRHIRDMKANGSNYVAGAIALETRIVGKIRGLQFSGTLEQPEGEELKKARSRYLRRFPVARLMTELHLWCLIPEMLKLTDNRLGFGKKLYWYAGDPEMHAR